jgi:hypothetical protein
MTGYENLKVVAGFAIALMISAGLASAASIDIGGKFGDEPGCKFAADPGNFSGSEYIVLTPEEFKTGSMSCDFVDSSPVWEKYGNRVFVVTALCGLEGSDTTVVDILRIEKHREEADTYSVFDHAGTEIGRGKRCQ